MILFIIELMNVLFNNMVDFELHIHTKYMHSVVGCCCWQDVAEVPDLYITMPFSH